MDCLRQRRCVEANLLHLFLGPDGLVPRGGACRAPQPQSPARRTRRTGRKVRL